MGKKRKPENDLEAERGLYSSFKTAANAVTQLYSHTVQAQRRSHEAGSRASLEKMMHWLIREHSNSATVSTAVIAQYLRREMEACDGRAVAHSQAFPGSSPPMHVQSQAASPSPRMGPFGQENAHHGNTQASNPWAPGCPPVQFGLPQPQSQKDGMSDNCGFSPMNRE